MVARALGPTDRGLLAIVLVLFAVLPTVVSFGGPALFRALAAAGSSPSDAYRRLRHHSWVGLAVSATMAVLLAHAMPLSSTAERWSVAALLAIAALVSYRNAVLSASIALGRVDLVTRNSFVQGISTLAIISGLFALDALTVTSVCLAYASVAIITFAISSRPLVWKESESAPVFRLKYALSSIPGQFGELMLMRVDQLIAPAILGLAAGGIYSVGWSYAFMLYPLAHTIALGKVSGHIEDRLRGAWVTPTLIATVAAIMAAVAFPVIHILFGDQYAASVPVALVLVVSFALFGLSTLYVQRNLSRGKAYRNSVSALFGIATILVLSVPLSTHNEVGIAWASVSGAVAGMIALIIFERFDDRRRV
ncbi:oligosaccharide flippase family protein [Microbacterium sp. ARD31]|uniref:lipopolysaccharide biosynthesis protein n=1 Tax=Microbacterium sp. ARD31 TaxID=2962576 RepID=UPI0028813160|nr:oligosaccharide flippase family protein [Microbacterium sp. ARD31]MDT0182961.1 oligosaccharide flippase family protein [Microbacterium sp. ARD31]